MVYGTSTHIPLSNKDLDEENELSTKISSGSSSTFKGAEVKVSKTLRN
jgi:hypothetical protein